MTDYAAPPGRIPASLAPYYLGMSREEFDQLAAPSLHAVPTCDGTGKTAYPRRQLDAWADSFKREQGRPPRQPTTNSP